MGDGVMSNWSEIPNDIYKEIEKNDLCISKSDLKGHETVAYRIGKVYHRGLLKQGTFGKTETVVYQDSKPFFTYIEEICLNGKSRFYYDDEKGFNEFKEAYKKVNVIYKRPATKAVKNATNVIEKIVAGVGIAAVVTYAVVDIANNGDLTLFGGSSGSSGESSEKDIPIECFHNFFHPLPSKKVSSNRDFYKNKARTPGHINSIKAYLDNYCLLKLADDITYVKVTTKDKNVTAEELKNAEFGLDENSNADSYKYETDPSSVISWNPYVINNQYADIEASKIDVLASIIYYNVMSDSIISSDTLKNVFGSSEITTFIANRFHDAQKKAEKYYIKKFPAITKSDDTENTDNKKQSPVRDDYSAVEDFISRTNDWTNTINLQPDNRNNSKQEESFKATNRAADRNYKTPLNNAGDLGEQNVDYQIKWLGKEYSSITKDCKNQKYDKQCILLKDEAVSDEAQEFDHIVIGKHKIFLIETKNLKQKLDIRENGNWVRIDNSGKETGMTSPIAQCDRHHLILKEFLADVITDDNILDVICIAHPESIITGESNCPIPVVKVDLLGRWIKEHDFGSVEIDDQLKTSITAKIEKHKVK
jgi:hypothetical protein